MQARLPQRWLASEKTLGVVGGVPVGLGTGARHDAVAKVLDPLVLDLHVSSTIRLEGGYPAVVRVSVGHARLELLDEHPRYGMTSRYSRPSLA